MRQNKQPRLREERRRCRKEILAGVYSKAGTLGMD
jgi:hypothetical protein